MDVLIRSTVVSTVVSIVVIMLMVPAASGEILRGVVKDPTGRPLEGARVSIDRAAPLLTGADGAFAVETTAGMHALTVSFPRFQTETRSISTTELAEVVLTPALSETIVVSGIRAEDRTPVTKTNIEREEIERRYHGQDIPLLLRDTPSINAYTESGTGGSGYSYISLRGISPSRINFTLDAVPLADGEDMATYFADFPDLAQSLQSIQVQRGVGTSSVGSASFGGSVNLQSIELSPERSTSARLVAGSYGTKQASVGYQSGALPAGYAFYTRLSYNESDGYRDNSGIRQHNLFFSGAKQYENAQLKLTGFSGHEDQQLSFYATDLATLKQDRRFNPLKPEERDSFGYDLAQLQYLRAVSPSSNLTASVYYQRGYGWYRLFDDSSARAGLRQYGLDGLFLGSIVTMSHTRGAMTANYGFHVNRFRREHTRDQVGGPRDYVNHGTKGEANAFAKLGYTTGPWLLYGDAQIRHAAFRYRGDVSMVTPPVVAIAPAGWTFFNPKLGARFSFSPTSSVYATAGWSAREPARNDFFHGEDHPSVAYDIHAVRPERLLDFESGWDYHARDLTLAANLYAMEFRNEIAATGELSDIGLPLRRNVDRSHRRGAEIDVVWRARPSLVARLTGNVSRNRMRTWTQVYDVYDTAGNYLTSKPLVHNNVEPLLSPEILFTATVDYRPARVLDLAATVRHVAESYLDNTNRGDLTTPAFTTVDATASSDLSRWIRAGHPRLTLQLNNLTNNRTVYPSGYSYPFITRDNAGGEAVSGIPYYYPQAGRHAVLMLDWRM